MLRSLLLSGDEAAIRIVAKSFKDLDVELEHYSDVKIAVKKSAELRYDAILVDDDVEDARLLLEHVMELPYCSKAVRIALADPSAKMDAVFKVGTQIIIYKPLSIERVRHGLRAVRNLMARERRKQVLIADLSESGAAIHFEAGDLPASTILNLDFALPGSPDRVHATAELVWQDNQGAAGLRFLDMPSFARKQLAEWLKETSKNSNVTALANRAGY